MSVLLYVLVGLAAVAGGLVNAPAGGGTLITFPVLTATGIPAITANITNTVALRPGYLGEKQKFPDKFVWARDALAKNTWYERWFDFFTLYDAASNGKPLLTGSQISADDQAAVEESIC